MLGSLDLTDSHWEDSFSHVTVDGGNGGFTPNGVWNHAPQNGGTSRLTHSDVRKLCHATAEDLRAFQLCFMDFGEISEKVKVWFLTSNDAMSTAVLPSNNDGSNLSLSPPLDCLSGDDFTESSAESPNNVVSPCTSPLVTSTSSFTTTKADAQPLFGSSSEGPYEGSIGPERSRDKLHRSAPYTVITSRQVDRPLDEGRQSPAVFPGCDSGFSQASETSLSSSGEFPYDQLGAPLQIMDHNGDSIGGPGGDGCGGELNIKRICLVCGDTSSGFHYGVASCEACKAFFKRTIQGNIEYTCPSRSDCEINKRRRKACQACRFQKCIRVGMLREGVRMDRVRGGRRKYQPRMDGLSLKMEESHRNQMGEWFFQRLLSLEDEEPLTANIDKKFPEGVPRTLVAMSDLADKMLVKIIEWAKGVPGFRDFSMDDQMELLQAGWGEQIVLRIMYTSMPYQGYIRLATNLTMNIEVFRAINSEEMYPVMLKFNDKFGNRPLTREEYIALKAVVLFNCDPHLQAVEMLDNLRRSSMAALQYICQKQSPDDHFRMHSIILALPVLRHIDVMAKQYWFNVKKEAKTPIKELFAEMLDSNLRISNQEHDTLSTIGASL